MALTVSTAALTLTGEGKSIVLQVRVSLMSGEQLVRDTGAAGHVTSRVSRQGQLSSRESGSLEEGGPSMERE